MQRISYARHRFPPEIIRHAICLYVRFTLSYRDVEELLAERGLDIKKPHRPPWLRSADSHDRFRILALNGPWLRASSLIEQFPCRSPMVSLR